MLLSTLFGGRLPAPFCTNTRVYESSYKFAYVCIHKYMCVGGAGRRMGREWEPLSERVRVRARAGSTVRISARTCTCVYIYECTYTRAVSMHRCMYVFAGVARVSASVTSVLWSSVAQRRGWSPRKRDALRQNDGPSEQQPLNHPLRSGLSLCGRADGLGVKTSF